MAGAQTIREVRSVGDEQLALKCTDFLCDVFDDGFGFLRAECAIDEIPLHIHHDQDIFHLIRIAQGKQGESRSFAKVVRVTEVRTARFFHVLHRLCMIYVIPNRGL